MASRHTTRDTVVAKHSAVNGSFFGLNFLREFKSASIRNTKKTNMQQNA